MGGVEQKLAATFTKQTRDWYYVFPLVLYGRSSTHPITSRSAGNQSVVAGSDRAVDLNEQVAPTDPRASAGSRLFIATPKVTY